jgi:hypothetical protein
MKRNHGNGGSCIKILLRDTNNAAVEGGATIEIKNAAILEVSL